MQKQRPNERAGSSICGDDVDQEMNAYNHLSSLCIIKLVQGHLLLQSGMKSSKVGLKLEDREATILPYTPLQVVPHILAFG